MTHPDQNLPPELQDIAARLRGERAEAGPLELDRIKLRAIKGAGSTVARRASFAGLIRSRLASPVLALALLIVGLAAIAGTTTGTPISLGGTQASSSEVEYCEPDNGDDDKYQQKAVEARQQADLARQQADEAQAKVPAANATAAEARQKADEAQQKADEAKAKYELAKKGSKAEKKAAEDEKKAAEAEAKKADEEAKKAESAAKKAQDDADKAEKDAQKAEEEAQKAEQKAAEKAEDDCD